MRPTVASGLVVAVSLALAACTAGTTSAPTGGPSTSTDTVVQTRTPPPAASFTPAPASSVANLKGGKTPRGEKTGRCPYIASGTGAVGGDTPGTNLANLEGDRVGRTTVLTRYQPVGCRFYFVNGYEGVSHEAVADILPTTFATADAAHNAMVLTAQAGRNQQSQPGFAPGADGIQYQTRFFGPDGDRDWAFVFAKGKVMVVVHTQQTDSQLNALLIGKAVVGKF